MTEFENGLNLAGGMEKNIPGKRSQWFPSEAVEP